MNSEKQNRFTKGTLWTVVLFYLLVAFEFFYMASPFAVYFYSVYKPGLSFIDKYPSVSWITGFFLPHLVEDTQSPLLNSIKTVGTIIASLGLLIFIICAGQVYYAKIFKKGMVSGGLYKYIRHPQYTAFAVCSFGLLLLWPRLLVLIMFITLLFAYYLLAKAEEKECTARYGDSYLSYKEKTFMFFPIKTRIQLPENFSGPARALTIAGIYLIIMVSVLKLGSIIKKSSIDALYSKVSADEIYVSIYDLKSNEFDHILQISTQDSLIAKILQDKKDQGTRFVNYIVPAEMYISEIPMLKPDNASCHVYNHELINDTYKIVYCAAKTKDNAIMKDGRDILFNTMNLEPLAELWIDLSQQKIVRSAPLPATTVRYKNIPEPVF